MDPGFVCHPAAHSVVYAPPITSPTIDLKHLSVINGWHRISADMAKNGLTAFPGLSIVGQHQFGSGSVKRRFEAIFWVMYCI